MKLVPCDDVDIIKKYDQLIFKQSWTVTQWQSWLHSPFNVCYLVYKQNICGFLSITCLTQDKTCEVIRVGVLPRYQRKNIAFRTFKAWFSMLPPMTRVLLEVHEKNHGAILLYNKLGFKEIAIRKKYYSHKDDAIVMEKIIDSQQEDNEVH